MRELSVEHLKYIFWRKSTSPQINFSMSPSIFDHVIASEADAMFDLKVRLDADENSENIDLGAGVYRNENGEYYELEVVRTAKGILNRLNLGHDYDLTTGNHEFLSCARKLVFGESSEAVSSMRIASVQTIGGTGANHLAAILSARWLTGLNERLPIRLCVYIGVPAWGNYTPLFVHAGLEVIMYRYYDTAKRSVDFKNVLKTMDEAPKGSVFVLQGCCHNQTGADLSPEQWIEIASLMRKRGQLPIFDIAYQGLGKGFDEDAFGIRHFVKQGFEMLICQSFSKNMGLYSERIGALHAVVANPLAATNVLDQLRSLVRWEFSSAPAYGARLATIIMSSHELYQKWLAEIKGMRERLTEIRETLYRTITNELKTPGNWQHILEETGLFCFLDLTPEQVFVLENMFHIYLTRTGRINIAGLNKRSLVIFTRALDQVQRDRLRYGADVV